MLVYTAIIGNKTDDLKEPVHADPGSRYVCFTDQNYESLVWDIRRVERPPHLTSRMFARQLKILCPFPREHTLWVDADFRLTNHNFSSLEALLTGPDHVMAMRNPWSKSIVDVAKSVKKLRKDCSDMVDDQLLKYAGITNKSVPATGILYRGPSADVCDFNEKWWAEMLEFPHERDQMSVQWAALLSGVRISYFNWTYTTMQWPARWEQSQPR